MRNPWLCGLILAVCCAPAMRAESPKVLRGERVGPESTEPLAEPQQRGVVIVGDALVIHGIATPPPGREMPPQTVADLLTGWEEAVAREKPRASPMTVTLRKDATFSALARLVFAAGQDGASMLFVNTSDEIVEWRGGDIGTLLQVHLPQQCSCASGGAHEDCRECAPELGGLALDATIDGRWVIPVIGHRSEMGPPLRAPGEESVAPLNLTLVLDADGGITIAASGAVDLAPDMGPTVPGTDGAPNLSELRDRLVEIKNVFPSESRVILTAHEGVPASTVVQAARIAAFDPPHGDERNYLFSETVLAFPPPHSWQGIGGVLVQP